MNVKGKEVNQMANKKFFMNQAQYRYSSVVGDNLITFRVPSEWAEQWVKDHYGMTVEEFEEEYTSEESQQMYSDAILDNVLNTMK